MCWYDTRLVNLAPGAYDSTVRGGEGTPLLGNFQFALNQLARLGDKVRLDMVCHGYYVGTEGGYGLQLWQGLHLYNVASLQCFRGKLDGIGIIGCGAAHIARGCEGKVGDGNLLCMRIAQWTQTRVRASTASQDVFVGTGAHPFSSTMPWKGTVLTYGPSGGVIAVEHYPLR
jgi:hypothetical protein